MPVGNVRQYPYFVRLFHTSTPLRSVELRMKKESRDLVASAGHLWKIHKLSLLVSPQIVARPGRRKGTLIKRLSYDLEMKTCE